MRHSSVYLLFISAGLLAIALIAGHARQGRLSADEHRSYRRLLVADLRLTDICLFTEARYTRHLSMADGHAPFQDHPVALEHFPSGALTTPPQLTQRHNDHTR